MRFNDRTHMFTYCEPVIDSSDQVSSVKDMVSHIPRDVSAQIYFQLGNDLPENLTKHAKIF